LKILGIHLLLDLEKCDPDKLDDLKGIENLLTRAAKDAGAKIVGKTFHKFNPMGITGVVAIAESHISVHTWPEYNYASADIFSCGEDFNIHTASNILIEGLNCQKPTIIRKERGLHD
tara:strand:- start:1574 stop:1924 length:351 start_codon:yes stop_codon:yes gene_type:complete